MDPKDRLPAEWPDFNPTDLLRRLTAGGVDFVVIGGIAVMLQGYPRATRDLDIAFAANASNLEALGQVLTGLESKLRGVEDELPFEADARTLAGIELLTLTTSLGWLDLQRRTPGVRDYESLRRHAERFQLDGFSVLVAGVDDLISMKHAAGRGIDMQDIAALEEIKRQRPRTA